MSRVKWNWHVMKGVMLIVVVCICIIFFVKSGDPVKDRVSDASRGRKLFNDFDFTNQYSNRPTKDVESSEKEQFISRQILFGSIFDKEGKQTSFEGPIMTSVAHSFSPLTEQTVEKMFQDDAKENIYRPLGPAIIRTNDNILMVQRIWLSQYEESLHMKQKKEMINTFQENYLYEQEFDENYKPISVGKIVLIPTPSNAMYTYRSDGPMDPRLIQVGKKVYLTFHVWSNEGGYQYNRGRTLIWDHQEHTITKPIIENYDFMKGEINWIPFDLNNTLHFVYNLDPLRVVQCHILSKCKFVQHPSYGSDGFHYSKDHLRGGTPFVPYRYPYYISMAHATTIIKGGSKMYTTHLVVMSVEPTFRLVYVSKPLDFHTDLLENIPIIRNFTIPKPFVFPVGIILRNKDVIDVGAHINDCKGFIIRIRGVQEIMHKVINLDRNFNINMGPPPRVIQKQVGLWVKKKFKDFDFEEVL